MSSYVTQVVQLSIEIIH